MASTSEIAVARSIIEDHVLKSYNRTIHDDSWRNLPEVPDKSEIMPKDDDRPKEKEYEEWNAYQKDPIYDAQLPVNITDGPWPSKEEYIGAHYQILREDAIAGLRKSVKSFRANPDMDDDNSTCVYTDVYFKGLVLSALGIAFRIEFSHERAGKQIRWEQSKRLQQGTMVALSPQQDMFRSICKIAIVAARPILGGVDQNPPLIDIFWGDHNDTVFDPVEPFLMLEARTGYFEASRHMLVALQKLRTESFPLAKHIVHLDPDIGPPESLQEHSFMDLRSLSRPQLDPKTVESLTISEEESLADVDVLEEFPTISSSGMDESQISACERILTKKLSIIQGPPGTGKTFTSVSGLRVMIDNSTSSDSPIIISAQTNHALDQLMNHVIAFEPNVLRLGGRSDKENIEIHKRTLHSLRMSTKGFKDGQKGMKFAYTSLEHRGKEIMTCMAPLLTESLLSDEILFEEGIITEDQKKSLFEEGWVSADRSGDPDGANINALLAWLGQDQLIPVPRAPQVNLGLPLEESDLEFEQLQEVELEGGGSQEEKDQEALSGTWVPFCRKWTGRSPPGVEDRKVRKLLANNDNFYDIPIARRGSVYRYFEKQLNQRILEKLRNHLKAYQAAVDTVRITKWVSNFKLIRHLGIKVIGCTTTGLSKYRGLLASLQPSTVLIEEAAETLEGTVIAGMFNSLDHLILVGDHQQLQAHCNVRALELPPYSLSVSMFERLVNNSIGYTRLNKQRRMISDVRKLLCIEPQPFYSNLQDHPSVLDREKSRPPIQGMGGNDTYFFHHTWPESRNGDSSRYNSDEAQMIAGFFNHLVLNGIKHSKITVLTFYNGQRKTILRELKRHPSLGANNYFNVYTVDSYQGEENDVILLSLVRSNQFLEIGFLENKNRLVVALSRARRGLYIFGNAVTLTSAETKEEVIGRDPLWDPLINYMKDHGRFNMDGGLPITCLNHGRTISVYEADHWNALAGGCDRKCEGLMPCGHQCPHRCHPFDHSKIICNVPCRNVLQCGHRCSKICGETCDCSQSACKAPEVGDTSLVDEKLQCDSSLVETGVALWDSPPKTSQQHRSTGSRAGDEIFSKTPRRTLFASSDVRKEMGGNFSVPPAAHSYSPGRSFVKSRNFNPKNPERRSPANSSPSSSPGADRWKHWDAQKADKEMHEERLRIQASAPKADLSTLVFKETYRAITIKDGVRVNNPSGSGQRVIQRVDDLLSAELGPPSCSAPPIAALEPMKIAPDQLCLGLSEEDPFVLPINASVATPRPLLDFMNPSSVPQNRPRSNLDLLAGLDMTNPYGNVNKLEHFDQLIDFN